MKEHRLEPWTPEDDERLRKLASEGRTVATIAERLKRPQGSIRGRAARLQIVVAKANGKMTDDSPSAVANMSQRAVMQYLSLSEWKPVFHLPVPAGEVMVDRIHSLGWIELRGMKPRTEVRLTPLGLAAMRMPIGTPSPRRGGSPLKAKGK
jgi:hypothetical protein